MAGFLSNLELIFLSLIKTRCQTKNSYSRANILYTDLVEFETISGTAERILKWGGGGQRIEFYAMVFDFSLLQISCSELSEVVRSGGVDNKIVCNIYDVNGVSSLLACENTITLSYLNAFAPFSIATKSEGGELKRSLCSCCSRWIK